MVTVITPRIEVFLDTAYVLALVAETDEYHDRAIQLSEQLEAARATLITTRAVLLEVGNALARRRYRASAIGLLQSFDADSLVEIISLSDELYSRALL